MNYNSFLTRDYKFMDGPSSHRKRRPPYTRLHVAVVVAAVIFLGTILSLVTSSAEAIRHDEQKIALLNEPLSRIHHTLTIPQAADPQGSDSVEEQPQSWSHLTIKPGHTLAGIFKHLDVSSSDLYQLMKKGRTVSVLRNLQPGNELQIQSDEAGHLQALIYQTSKLESIHVQRVADDFIIDTITKPIENRIAFSSGVINSSLFEAGKLAGLSDALVMEMAGIFGWDIDFALDIRENDKFAVLYEEHFVDGQKLHNGAILAAEFTNQGKTYRAIRYTDESGRSNYYTPEGLSMRKAFLRTPVDFRRISSRFGNRHHPTLNKMRMHKGVDYAAPRGTPIKVSGDGKVIFKGTKGGYGRVVIVQHGSRYSTLYAHMNSFARKIHVGSRVRQGQTIGYVGSSGRATGPHLHYEFRVNGVHRNPLTVALPNAAPIDARYKSDFMDYAGRMLTQLNMNKPTRVALNNR